MIGYLHGKLISKNQDNSCCTFLCLSEVGYEVTVPRSFWEGAVLDQSYSLWIYTHVREDMLGLFGFTSENERGLFRILLGLSGLGPKGAMSLISEHGAQGLASLILQQDAHGISKAPGIGKKLAQKIILELQSKVQKITWLESHAVLTKKDSVMPLSQSDQRREDLASALHNLGFALQIVRPALEKLESQSGWEKQPFEGALRMALKELSRHAVPEGAANV